MSLKAAETPFASMQQVPASWRLLDDSELMELPDPEFTIDGILARRSRTVIYGPPGSCKTTLAAGLMVSVTTGRKWFGHEVCHCGPCCYVAAEDVAGFKVRLRAAKVAAGLPLTSAIGVYTFPEPIDLRDGVGINSFIRFVSQTDVAMELVVIDTYAGATPGAAENSSEDTTVAMNAAAKIQADLRCGVVLIHHTNAGGTRERGHSSMRGAADTMISVTPVDDVIHVECSKQRNAAPFETFTLKLTPVPDVGGVVVRLAAEVLPSSALTPLQEKVLAALRETATSRGVTKGEWQKCCQDVAERSFYRAAKVLEDTGHVTRAGTHFCVGGRSE